MNSSIYICDLTRPELTWPPGQSHLLACHPAGTWEDLHPHAINRDFDVLVFPTACRSAFCRESRSRACSVQTAFTYFVLSTQSLKYGLNGPLSSWQQHCTFNSGWMLHCFHAQWTWMNFWTQMDASKFKGIQGYKNKLILIEIHD